MWKKYYKSYQYWNYFKCKDEFPVGMKEKEKGEWTYFHRNCNARAIKTSQERKRNLSDIFYEREIREEYGIGFKTRRTRLPCVWDDIQIKGTRSWKKLTKRKKQYRYK